MEEENQGVFEVEEEKEEVVKPLVNEDFNFDNIMNNPILKPISECNQAYKDLEELKIKDLKESKSLMKYVNETLSSDTTYQESYFIGRLIELLKKFSNIVKISDLQEAKLVSCIREMREITIKKYGVIVEESESQIIEVQSDADYLKGLMNNEDKNICEIANLIFENYQKSTERNLKIKYEKACTELYKTEPDKERMKVIAQIYRKEK